jgi:hemerythrin superfamily protein
MAIMATRAKDSKSTPSTKTAAPRKGDRAAADKTADKAADKGTDKTRAKTAPAAPAGLVDDIKAVPAKAVAATHQAADTVKTVAAKLLPSAEPAPSAKKAKAVAAKTPPPPAKTGIGAGTVLGAAAAGLAAGLVANLGRKAAIQAPSVMAGDWLAALKAEHKAALALVDQLGKTTTRQVAMRTLLLTQLRHALSKHAFTEENVIYAALREWGDKADADALNHEQAYHKQYLYELDGLPRDSEAFAQRVEDFRIDLESHMREEEEKIFPKLHEGLSADKNKALTALANKEGFKLA